MMFASIIIIVTVFFSALLEVTQSQRAIGDLCTLQATGTEGICKLLVDCPKALQELQSSNKIPQNCGFQGTAPIACCQKDQQLQPQQQPTQQPQLQQKPGSAPGQVSKEKCREYSKYTVEKVRPPILIPNAGFIERNVCGHKVGKLITGRELAGRTEFPHMASIGYEVAPAEIKWLCGGSIISEKYILTAAHCLISVEFGPSKWVRMGLTDLNDETIHKQDIAVAERIAHPDYRFRYLYHDIALIKLQKDIKLESYARPACLYTKYQIDAEKCIATGWANTTYGGVSNNQLRKVVLDFFDHPSCNYSYRNQINRRLLQGILDESQICAGSKTDEETHICKGYSGGPLQIYHVSDDIKCMYDIVGVTSFDKDYHDGSPGVYTRVSHYIKWIEDIVWPESSQDQPSN